MWWVGWGGRRERRVDRQDEMEEKHRVSFHTTAAVHGGQVRDRKIHPSQMRFKRAWV